MTNVRPQIYRVVPKDQSVQIKIPRAIVRDLSNAELHIVRRMRPHIEWAMSISDKRVATLDLYADFNGFWIEPKSSAKRDAYGWDGESCPIESSYRPESVYVEQALSVLRQELNAFGGLATTITEKCSVLLSLEFKNRRLNSSDLRRLRRVV